ncbi:hypothetical protein [Streptomyces sp. NPDC093591]|uniref:immunity protein TriTu family protein n=1 Tax=Streptomyces sp. NPDC093591 TaxID=3366044 RepID=UPI00382C7C14
MAHGEVLLSALRSWVVERGTDPGAEGVSLTLDESRIGMDKASLSLAIDGDDFVGQLTVWESGEAELEFAEVGTGAARHEHREFHSVADLRQALADLLTWSGETGGEG